MLDGEYSRYQSAFNAPILAKVAIAAQCPEDWVKIEKAFGGHDARFRRVIFIEVHCRTPFNAASASPRYYEAS